MKFDRILKNPYLLFLPFLLFYIIFVLLLHSNGLWEDEVRHMFYANNLLHGFYSPPPPDVDLEIGPGYPIILLPFIILHLPLLTVKLLNAVLLYFSCILVYKILLKYVSFKKVLVFSLFWACYYNCLDYLALIYTETLTVFLVSLLLFFLTKAINSSQPVKTNKYLYFAGFTFGYLALTKIIFGYVLTALLLGLGVLWLMNRKAVNYRKAIIIMLVAFTTVLPYLVYTYSLTGRVLYWGTSGGLNLYPMTMPEENEYGSYLSAPRVNLDSAVDKNGGIIKKAGSLNLKNRVVYVPGYLDSITAHHLKTYLEIRKFRGVELDDAYKRVAINNIKSHPVKYLQNCFSNMGRILFNYPYSYTVQKPGTLVRLPLNGTIVVLMLFCIFPTVKNWRYLDFSIRFMLTATILYLGASVLGSAEIRMFTIVVPVILVWIAFVLQRTIKINMNKWTDNT